MSTWSRKLRTASIEAAKVLSLPASIIRLWSLESSARLRFNLQEMGLLGPAKLKLRLFNLDLHASVIEDLAQNLRATPAKLIRFSISNHNHISRFPLWAADPVSVINNRTWKKLDGSRISKFQRRYKKFLGTFDGFIATYSPTFFEFFRVTDKPILAVAATRYEAPYTSSPSKWAKFNESLISAVQDGQLTLAANNRGDADYLRYFTGLEVQVVPSFCGGKETWTGKSRQRVTLAKDGKLRNFIMKETGGTYKPIDFLGVPYKWRDLMECLEIFVVPQNISTMTLFELATAGVPVAVPSRELFRELKGTFSGVLDELTFAEILNVHVSSDEGNPANWRGKNYLDWWLERADFYNEDLMPNVRIVKRIGDLMIDDQEILERRTRAQNLILERNVRIHALGQGFISNWVSQVESHQRSRDA